MTLSTILDEDADDVLEGEAEIPRIVPREDLDAEGSWWPLERFADRRIRG